MATSAAEFRRIVNYTDLEALLECPLCLDRFDQPRLIPCGHTYCTKCLTELCADSDTVICPQCRTLHAVPQAGVQHFPRNFSYQKLLDIRTEELVSTRQCQVCDRKRAFSDCVHCQKAVCLECKEAHRRELSNTTVSLLEELARSSDLCREALQMEMTAFSSHVETVRKQITAHAKQLIEHIKHQAKSLSHELDEIMKEQIEVSKQSSGLFERRRNEIDRFIQISSKKLNQKDTMLAENYIEIQETTEKHLRNIQTVIDNLKSSRRDITFTPNFDWRHEEIGEIASASLSSNENQQNSANSNPATTNESTIREIGQWGNGPGEFWCPSGLIVTADNQYLVIVDSWNHRIQVMTTDGRFVRSSSGNKGNGTNELDNPRDICFDQRQQSLIVTDSRNHRLVIFNFETLQPVKMINNENSSIKFLLPHGICCDEQDRIYICDRGNHRIVVIDLHTDAMINQWGKRGTKPGEFNAPDFLCCRKNLIAVSDFNNHRIQVFSLSGQFIFTFGRFGSGSNGEFKFPRGILIDNEGFFMVSDWANNRLQLFSPKGDLTAIIAEKNSENAPDDIAFVKLDLDRPVGVAVSSDGVVFATEWGRSHRILIH